MYPERTIPCSLGVAHFFENHKVKAGFLEYTTLLSEYTVACLAQLHLSLAPGHCKRERSPSPMDTLVMIMFGSVLCSLSGLIFMELRRIRKKLEAK